VNVRNNLHGLHNADGVFRTEMSLPKKSAKEKTAEATEKAADVQVTEIDRLKKELEQEKSKSQDYLNRLKYLQADFENYRKRIERTLAEQIQFGNERLIRSLLGILDELDLAVQACKKTQNTRNVAKGIEMVADHLKGVLSDEGLETIEGLGKTYNAARHEAVGNVPDDTKPEGTIIEEIRKGFMYKGKVIRPSMVKVTVSHKGNSTDIKMKEKDE
jgi:molecular chaperone GrpE